LRDVLVSKDPQTIELLEVGADIGNRYKLQAQNCSVEFLFQALKISNDCDIEYRLSKNKRLLVELSLIRLCQLTNEKKKSIISDDAPIPLQKIILAKKNDEILEQKKVEIRSGIKKTSEALSEPKVGFQRPNSISIIATQAISTQEVVTENAAELIINNKPFTKEELWAAWHKYTETIPEQGRIVSLMLNNKPNCISDNNYEIIVSNVLQDKEMNRLLPTILSFLQSQINNSHLTISVKIAEETEKQRGNSPEERFRIMVEENSALATLRNNLKLEID